mgnify:CR=1 FL=1
MSDFENIIAEYTDSLAKEEENTEESAVVVENDNPASSGTVMVVPLKSADSEADAKKEIHERN